MCECACVLALGPQNASTEHACRSLETPVTQHQYRATDWGGPGKLSIIHENHSNFTLVKAPALYSTADSSGLSAEQRPLTNNPEPDSSPQNYIFYVLYFVKSC